MAKYIALTKGTKEVYSAEKTKASKMDSWCNALSPDDTWFCSRPKGHTCKRHVAHGGEQVMCVWED